VDRNATRSLDLLLEHVQGVRAQQLQHFDALDSKAGVLGGRRLGALPLATF
jgi:hypothetical protein